MEFIEVQFKKDNPVAVFPYEFKEAHYDMFISIARDDGFMSHYLTEEERRMLFNSSVSLMRCDNGVLTFEFSSYNDEERLEFNSIRDKWIRYGKR